MTEKVSIKQETVSDRRAKRAEKRYTSQQTDGEKRREVKNMRKMKEMAREEGESERKQWHNNSKQIFQNEGSNFQSIHPSISLIFNKYSASTDA